MSVPKDSQDEAGAENNGVERKRDEGSREKMDKGGKNENEEDEDGEGKSREKTKKRKKEKKSENEPEYTVVHRGEVEWTDFTNSRCVCV